MAQKQAEATIWRQANYDGLTDLPNRHMFQDRLEHELKSAARTGDRLALLFLDLDHFKEVNDTLGHQMGDLLLRQAADRLRACVRESDLIARLGGDEFVIVLAGLHDNAGASAVARKILDALACAYDLQGKIAYVSASIGITLFPEDGGTAGDLLRNADQAMYDAKKSGRNRYCYFRPALQEAVSERVRIGIDLRRALGTPQLWVAYQPVVRLADGAVLGAEALMRWRHPEQGEIPPSRFIPVAENSGLIHEIGDWLFRTAIGQLAVWRREHPALLLGVNKSPEQFRRAAPEVWLGWLRAAGLPGSALVVEITESLLLDAGDNTLDQLLAYSRTGVQVAMDDFGTGYSSLAYLKKFHIDFLKIDASFVRNMAAGNEDRALCEAMVTMAHRLGLRVVAEGVETEEQRALLQAMGCDFGQGFLFSRPLPAEEFGRYLAASPEAEPSGTRRDQG